MFAVIFFLFSIKLIAVPVLQQPLSDLISKSDLVFEGEVVKVERLRSSLPQSNTDAILHVRPMRIMKSSYYRAASDSLVRILAKDDVNISDKGRPYGTYINSYAAEGKQNKLKGIFYLSVSNTSASDLYTGLVGWDDAQFGVLDYPELLRQVSMLAKDNNVSSIKMRESIAWIIVFINSAIIFFQRARNANVRET
ncbi:MAG: hypothetical protein WCP06_10365 [Verrucomicrobiota bacterium]